MEKRKKEKEKEEEMQLKKKKKQTLMIDSPDMDRWTQGKGFPVPPHLSYK